MEILKKSRETVKVEGNKIQGALFTDVYVCKKLEKLPKQFNCLNFKELDKDLPQATLDELVNSYEFNFMIKSNGERKVINDDFLSFLS